MAFKDMKPKKVEQDAKESCSNCMHSFLLLNLYTCRLQNQKVLASNWCQYWDYLEEDDLKDLDFELFDDDDDGVSRR